MKKIYTSYYSLYCSKTRLLKSKRLAGVRITVGVPSWCKEKIEYEYLKLAPFGVLGEEDWGVYRELYYSRILGRLDPKRVYRELLELTNPYTPVLLCYEPPKEGYNCHRWLVAEWMKAAGIEVEEFGYRGWIDKWIADQRNLKVAVPQSRQGDLFSDQVKEMERKAKERAKYVKVLGCEGSVCRVEGSTGNVYEVDTERGTCTCPFFQNRWVKCKHIYAVEKYLGKEIEVKEVAR